MPKLIGVLRRFAARLFGEPVAPSTDGVAQAHRMLDMLDEFRAQERRQS